MKELSSHIKESIAQYAQREVPKKKVFIGSFTLQGGQKVYEMNLKTGVVCEATFAETVVKVGEMGNSVSKNIVAKENCMYAAAINQNNAARKIIKAITHANDR